MRQKIFLFLASLTVTTGCVQNNHPQSQPVVMLKGSAIVGTTFTTSDDQGQSLTLKIAAVEPDAQNRDIYLYTVLSRSTTSQWQNLCQPDKTGVAKAVPLSGQWDKTGAHLNNEQITFACTNDIRAKCVRLGYKPWKTVNGQSLRPYHQACTRMLRADYCGNGIAHTQEGTPIDVYDRLQIQQPTPNSGMTFEAAWNADGAVWLSRTRYPNTLKQLQQECPEKLKKMFQPHQTITAELEQETADALLFNQFFRHHAN